MAETVRDIIGKGFKYEEREKIQRLTEVISGTIGAFVGGANWGPIGSPTLVEGDFESVFGTPLVKSDEADFSGLAAKYTLNSSPYCWFTRVSAGGDLAATYAVIKAAEAALLTGSVALTESGYVVRSVTDPFNPSNIRNDTLALRVFTAAHPAPTGVPVNVTLTPTPAAASLESVDLSSVIAKSDEVAMLAYNFETNNQIAFTIDGVSFTYTVPAAGTGRNANQPDFQNLVIPATGTVPAGYTTPAAGTDWADFTPDAGVDTYAERLAYALRNLVVLARLEALYPADPDNSAMAAAIVTSLAGVVSLNSVAVGAASSTVMTTFACPGGTVFTVETNSSVNTDIANIVGDINDAIETAFAPHDAGAVAAIDAYGHLAFSSTATGATEGIAVEAATNSAYVMLGLTTGTSDMGADAIADAGLFEAVYTGSDGNSIILDVQAAQSGYIMTVYFRGYVIATFFNFSYNVADANFIGTLIANDTYAKKIVRLVVADGVTTLPSFSYGQMQLSGGTSGLAAIPASRYVIALESYKNVDLYNVDMVCVSGGQGTTQTVQDALQSVCEYRKDCFAVVDAPESVAGTTENGGSATRMINWHNGVGGLGRTAALDSKYVATYFPWLSINDGTDDYEYTWYPPSVRVVGAIAQSDKIAGHKFAAPAGNFRTALSEVEHLAQYLREDEKNTLYADELGNSINPLVFTTTRGFFIDGQKNTDRDFTAISRLNVLKTSLYIKKRMYEIAPSYFWAPLTKRTQDELAEELRSMCRYLSSSEIQAMKEDYTIVCDSSINTAVVEAQRGLIASVEWTPVRSIEKIKIISIIRDLKVEVQFA